MSLKWTGNRSESGILRKSEFKEKKEELFVFGYSCKLFRDNEKALHIDQGKHLIPWMGDETLKIDRYDARGALHDLSSLEAPPGGYDWRVELTRNERDVEQLCDEERYRALHTNEDEEEMYKEEELKRLHAAGYGQVGFNYDTPKAAEPVSQPAEVDEPFLPTASFKALLPSDMVLPDSLKQNAIIEKTAKFIAAQGAQMEILIKAKQRDNSQFKFLDKDSPLNLYYSALIGLIKTEKWPDKKPEVIEEKLPENDEYLHPSLASTIIEAAPSIPSIHYKPSADCDYTMLISKMRGACAPDEPEAPELAPGEVAPPGTQPLPPRAAADISRPPLMYNLQGPHNNAAAVQAAETLQYQQYQAQYQQYMAAVQPPPVAKAAAPAGPQHSTGLSLMTNYNTDSDSDNSDYDDSSSTDSKEPIATPPEDVQVVIDKMAAYVARNGDEFAEIVRAKNDPRFTFLEPDNVYHTFYKRLMQQKRGIDVNGKGKNSKKKSSAPVSFSIKKFKEPDPILPKPALPYESSSDEESEKTEKSDEPKDVPKAPSVAPTIPPVVVYKIETKEPVPIKPIEPVKIVPTPIVKPKEVPKIVQEEKVLKEEIKPIQPVITKEVRAKSLTPDTRKPPEKIREKESPRSEKRKHKEKKKEFRSKSETRESKRPERLAKEKRNDKEGDRERKRRRYSRDELDSEIISLVDTMDDLIDLTGDQSDSKGEIESEADKAKQQERRRRAAEFLKKVGVDPAAAALPTSSLASAMVDTLETIRKKKAEEEEKRRKREKRRHRDRFENESGSAHRKSKRRKYKSSDENEELDFDGTKKKKRKKDKKSSKKQKKRRREIVEEEEEEEMELPLNIDLQSTLKELRSASPTTELVQEAGAEDEQQSRLEEKEHRRERKKKKEEREYSEGEWSSDSAQDSGSTASGIDD